MSKVAPDWQRASIERFNGLRDTSGGPDSCWPWRGKPKPDGYGQVRMGGENQYPHRVAVMLDGRDIPAGMVVDHTCRNRACCNPAHLRVVTSKVNALENSDCPSAVNALKTHCVNGHELTGSNLRIQIKNGKPKRRCHQCSYDYCLRSRAKRGAR